MQYISKEERKIDFTDPQGKWTDLTILPEWEEEFYDVYTAKKYGKVKHFLSHIIAAPYK